MYCIYFVFILIYSLYINEYIMNVRVLSTEHEDWKNVSMANFFGKKSEELMFNNSQVSSVFFLLFIFNWFFFHECVSSLLSWNSKPNFYFILQMHCMLHPIHIMSGKKCTYNDAFLKMGFTSIVQNSVVKPQCVICAKVLSRGSMKPSKLKGHLDACHSNLVGKEMNYFKRREKRLLSRQIALIPKVAVLIRMKQRLRLPTGLL